MRELRDRVAVVTGAASGIGRALAIELARQGMHVVLADLDAQGMAVTEAAITALGRRALCVPTDVRDGAALEALLARTLAHFGSVHVMVNNAGLFRAGAAVELGAHDWQRTVDTNLWGVIHGCRVFGAHFAAQGAGQLVNTASAAGLFPVPGMTSYSTTKFAVVGLSLQLRWELAEAGVGVTVVCPGVVRTPIVEPPEVGLLHLDPRTLVANAPPPEALARKVVAAIRKNRGMVRFGAESYALSLLRLFPLWLVDPLGRWLARTALRTVRPPKPHYSADRLR